MLFYTVQIDIRHLELMNFVICLLPGVLFITFSITVKLYTSQHETLSNQINSARESFLLNGIM